MTAKRWLAVAMWLVLLAATAAYVLLLLNDPGGTLDRAGIFPNVIALVFGTTGGGEGQAWLSVVTSIGLIGVLSIPVTTGMAIVRHRLYQIDRLISRTLTYGLLAGLLAAVYAAGVFLVGTLAFDDGIGVALSTLVVAALFNPLRKQLHARIDRRFSRSGYDAQEVLDAFSRSIADLLEVVDETVVPEGAADWVRQTRGAR